MRFKVHQRKVAAIGRRHDDPRRSEVNAKSHCLQFTMKQRWGSPWKSG
jgi:hypothetical protein